MMSKPGEVLARVFHCEQSDPNQWRHICGTSIKVIFFEPNEKLGSPLIRLSSLMKPRQTLAPASHLWMEEGDREGRAWLEQVEAVSAGLEVNFSLAQYFLRSVAQ